LHNQVRILTGTLKMVGEGAWTIERPRAALDACERAKAGPTAPPTGLYLTKVVY
jgi:tRNA pseudouridine38-40 synthase